MPPIVGSIPTDPITNARRGVCRQVWDLDSAEFDSQAFDLAEWTGVVPARSHKPSDMSSNLVSAIGQRVSASTVISGTGRPSAPPLRSTSG